MLVEENDSGDESQGDNYGMAGWRAFFALCWPLHQCLNNGSFPSLSALAIRIIARANAAAMVSDDQSH
jgi:hypothetical protein